jgi:hypothetical protein
MKPGGQRAKGHSFERRICRLLREAFPQATIRRGNQSHRAVEPDVVIEGTAPEALKRAWLELNDSRAPDPPAKLEQAARDALRASDGMQRLPLVVWHRIREREIWCTGRLETLLQVLGVDAEWPPEGMLVTVRLGDVIQALRKEATC